MSLEAHLFSEGPKRILALDGGGIRGALTLGYLQRIEELLRQRHGDDTSFRLCDYFDLIGGTSTGSIIAACLAVGMSVEEIREKYFELGGRIFGKKYRWWDPVEWKKLSRLVMTSAQCKPNFTTSLAISPWAAIRSAPGSAL